MLVCVVNWFSQSIYLGQSDYQSIINRLEKDREQESLNGIDSVLIITKMGEIFLFHNTKAMCLDTSIWASRHIPS